MSTESGYNGWANYETWCVALWLSNDEGLYHKSREIVQATTGSRAPYEAAEALRAWVDDFHEIAAVREQASFVSDLLGAALSEVDWYEIAENIGSELAEEVDAR